MPRLPRHRTAPSGSRHPITDEEVRRAHAEWMGSGVTLRTVGAIFRRSPKALRRQFQRLGLPLKEDEHSGFAIRRSVSPGDPRPSDSPPEKKRSVMRIDTATGQPTCYACGGLIEPWGLIVREGYGGHVVSHYPECPDQFLPKTFPMYPLAADTIDAATGRDLARVEDRVALVQLLHVLPLREREVLALRYGLFGEEEHTLQAVGEAMLITRERVRQLEQQALKRMRAAAEGSPVVAAEDAVKVERAVKAERRKRKQDLAPAVVVELTEWMKQRRAADEAGREPGPTATGAAMRRRARVHRTEVTTTDAQGRERTIIVEQDVKPRKEQVIDLPDSLRRRRTRI